ncbi:MAG: arylsulfatase [Pirellulaceae bacterium]|jgi:arylsulfatase A-like enzyme
MLRFKHLQLFSLLLGLMLLASSVERLSGQGIQQENASPVPPRPNLIWIVADDLGYGELGSYGQKTIATPRLDQMASEGMRWTRFYSGATVCAPSRSVLMTGLHHGHTPVRGNAGKENPQAQALPDGTLTIAKAMQNAGYRTALIGKWGLGDIGPAQSGLPNRQGFDFFYGFLNQRHAHNHYPSFLWRNDQKESLPNDLVELGGDGAGYATQPQQYADDLFLEESIRWIDDRNAHPFFLMLSLVSPHANNERRTKLGDGTEVPSLGSYQDAPWPAQDRGHAAMIGHMDHLIGKLLDHLRRTRLDQNTLVLFTSDNGPHQESGHDPKRFQPSGPLRGFKRSLTDGGIRVPMIAWWPGTVHANSTSHHVSYQGDLFATALELAEQKAPPPPDSISLAKELRGNGATEQHEFLYWEFHEQGFRQAALYQGRWKGIRSGGADKPIVLYDLLNDPSESNDVAADHPQIVGSIDRYLRDARSDSIHWPARW